MNHPISNTSVPALGSRLITFIHAVLFVFGFSLIFIVGWAVRG